MLAVTNLINKLLKDNIRSMLNCGPTRICLCSVKLENNHIKLTENQQKMMYVMKDYKVCFFNSDGTEDIKFIRK